MGQLRICREGVLYKLHGSGRLPTQSTLLAELVSPSVLGLTQPESSNVVDDRDYVKAMTESTKKAEPVITYAIQAQARLLSAWADNHYFTGVFPTLFPHGIGGHLDERNSKVSLEAFAKWALNHHSRRCDFLSLPATFR
jgi:hypothetical protein